MHEDPLQSESLPPQAFVDPAQLHRELTTLFRGWVLADLPTCLDGQRAPFAHLGAPYFLQDDVAYANVCTHAWHTLVQKPEPRGRLQCPQHGRTFDAEGQFVGQPGAKGMAQFPRGCDHLARRAVRRWGPLGFVGAPEAPWHLNAMSECVFNLPIDALQLSNESTRVLPGNWKTHASNFLDSLHIPFVHPELQQAVGQYQTELHPGSVLQWAYAKDPARGFEAQLLPARFRGDGRVYALWWFIYPNLSLNFYPWGLSVNAYHPVPGSPQETQFVWQQWTWGDKNPEDWHLSAVDDQDVAALAQVNRGVASPDAVPGRFLPGEEAIHWFQRAVWLDCQKDQDVPPQAN